MHLLPLQHDSKKPIKGESWYDTMSADMEDHAQWLRDGLNVGFPLKENGCSVIDFDDKEAARKWWREYGSLVAVAVETRRGVHCFFSGETQTRKFEHGDIKGNGYTVFPPSVVDGWEYRFIRNNWKELQPFPEHLFPIEKKEVIKADCDIYQRIVRARAYVSTVEGAVSGQNGHGKTYRVACKLIKDFALSVEQALPIMLEFNERCVPPWSTRDLVHKLRSVK